MAERQPSQILGHGLRSELPAQVTGAVVPSSAEQTAENRAETTAAGVGARPVAKVGEFLAAKNAPEAVSGVSPSRPRTTCIVALDVV